MIEPKHIDVTRTYEVPFGQALDALGIPCDGDATASFAVSSGVMVITVRHETK
jgi:hypothetical protein